MEQKSIHVTQSTRTNLLFIENLIIESKSITKTTTNDEITMNYTKYKETANQWI